MKALASEVVSVAAETTSELKNPVDQNVVNEVPASIDQEPSSDKPPVQAVSDIDTKGTQDTPPTSNHTPGAPSGDPIQAPTSGVSGIIEMVPRESLKPHPLSIATYGTSYPPNLKQSILESGIMVPLIVVRKTLEILSGISRWTIAGEVGIQYVPVTWFDSDDPLDIEAAVLATNKTRPKTLVHRTREFIAWKRIETGKARSRMATKRRGDQGVENLAHAESGKARDLAAKHVGVSSGSLEKGEKVLKQIDKLRADGKDDLADDLEKRLNESFDAGFIYAKSLGLIQTRRSTAKKAAGEAETEIEDTPEPEEWVEKNAAEPEKMPPVTSVTAEAKSSPPPTPSDQPRDTDSEVTAAHEAAYHHADEVVSFLRSPASEQLTTQHRTDWGKILGQIISLMDRLGLKAA